MVHRIPIVSDACYHINEQNFVMNFSVKSKIKKIKIIQKHINF